MTTIQIIFHEKLKAIQCFCGFIGRNHQCEKTVNGKVTFRNCLEEYCSKCQDKINRDEYNETRWSTNRDGTCYESTCYESICGTCYEKISEEICTNCFCLICYVSLEEYCSCQRED